MLAGNGRLLHGPPQVWYDMAMASGTKGAGLFHFLRQHPQHRRDRKLERS
jgi:hypothetical protein